MGDQGKLYVDASIVPAYRNLLRDADLILPNQFELECVPYFSSDFFFLTACLLRQFKSHFVLLYPHSFFFNFFFFVASCSMIYQETKRSREIVFYRSLLASPPNQGGKSAKLLHFFFKNTHNN